MAIDPKIKGVSQVYAQNTYDVQYHLLRATDVDQSVETKGVYVQSLSPASIINFTIQETLANWVTSATMIVQYTPTANEDFLVNDGKDLLYVRILPIFPGGTNPNADMKQWKLEYTFSIHDIVDYSFPAGMEAIPTNVGARVQKLSLVDYRFHKLKTNDLLYSSGLNPDGLSTTDLKRPTGIIIQDILKLSGLARAIPTDTTLWDKGNNFFYTSPVGSTAEEDLMYVLNHHSSQSKTTVSFSTSDNLDLISKTGALAPDLNVDIYDFCLLKCMRDSDMSYTINTTNLTPGVSGQPQDLYIGQMSLLPISNYFKGAGNTADAPGIKQTEHFFISSNSEVDSQGKGNFQPYRSPVSKNVDYNKDVKIVGYSEIIHYTSIDIPSEVNEELFKSRMVNYVNTSTGSFNIEVLPHRIETARKYIGQQYINNLYKSGGAKPEDYFLIEIDKNKKTLSNTDPTFSLYGDSDQTAIRQTEGIHHLLKLGIFLNTGINFRAKGLSIRQAGVFIGIDKPSGLQQSTDDKLLGQYFVIDVKHVFEGEAYYNDITAVKIHRFNVKKT